MGEVSAMKCHDIREMLAFDPTIADADVQAHVDTCAGCARYYRQHQTIDVVLRAELQACCEHFWNLQRYRNISQSVRTHKEYGNDSFVGGP